MTAIAGSAASVHLMGVVEFGGVIAKLEPAIHRFATNDFAMGARVRPARTTAA